MSKGVIKTKPVKPDPYANYTAAEIADMMANTTEDLQYALRKLDDIDSETEAYQHDLDSAWSRYQEELENTRHHQEEKRKAEVRVQELTDNLKVIAEGFNGKIGKK